MLGYIGIDVGGTKCATELTETVGDIASLTVATEGDQAKREM